MIYLERFKFASFNDDLDFRPSDVGVGWYETKYPFGILSQHQIEKIEFEPITIFYGGNGCGKSTLMLIMSLLIKTSSAHMITEKDTNEESQIIISADGKTDKWERNANNKR